MDFPAQSPPPHLSQQGIAGFVFKTDSEKQRCVQSSMNIQIKSRWKIQPKHSNRSKKLQIQIGKHKSKASSEHDSGKYLVRWLLEGHASKFFFSQPSCTIPAILSLTLCLRSPLCKPPLLYFMSSYQVSGAQGPEVFQEIFQQVLDQSGHSDENSAETQSAPEVSC